MNELKFVAIDKDDGNFYDVLAVDIVNNKVTIGDSKKSHEKSTEDVELLRVIFENEKLYLADGDIIADIFSGRKYLIRGTYKKDVIEVVRYHDTACFEEDKPTYIDITNKTEMDNLLINKDYYSNIHKIEIEKIIEQLSKVDFDFDIMAVKDKQLNYFYALNDKEDQTVDLIPVLFVGANLINGEVYYREEFSYNDYEENIEDGTFVEVTPQELQNYALGKMHHGNKEYFAQPTNQYSLKDVEKVAEIKFGDIDPNSLTPEQAEVLAQEIAKQIFFSK